MQPPKEPCERNALVLIHKCDICTCGLPTKWTERTALPCFCLRDKVVLAACKTLAALSCAALAQVAQTDATDVCGRFS